MIPSRRDASRSRSSGSDRRRLGDGLPSTGVLLGGGPIKIKREGAIFGRAIVARRSVSFAKTARGPTATPSRRKRGGPDGSRNPSEPVVAGFSRPVRLKADTTDEATP